MPEIKADDVSVSTLAEEIVQEVSRAIVGKTDVLYKMLSAFLSGGHVLLEDYPGLAKTLIASSFASVPPCNTLAQKVPPGSSTL